MDWLEEELKNALGRQEPSPDFLRRPRRARILPARRWLAAAAVVLAAIGAGGAVREYRGHAAKERVLLAVRIAAGKMNRIQMQVRGAAQ